MNWKNKHMNSPREFESSNGSEFSSQSEIERAKKGVAEFKRTFAASNFRQRRLLRYGKNAECLQNTFLGLKPVSQTISGLEDVQGLQLPQRFRFSGVHLYDQELVKEKIAQNPDVFPEFQGADNLDEQVETFLESSHAVSRDKDNIRKIGLLFGFPRDAVVSYAEHIEFYRNALQYFHGLSRIILRGETGFSDLEKDMILHIGYIDRKARARVESNYLENFLDRYGQEAKAFLRDYYSQLTQISEDEIDYLVGNRPVSVRGIHYATGIPTKATLDFPHKVEEIYRLSGMNSTLRATSLLLTVK